MTPHVLVNGRFLSRRLTGVERYGTEILRHLASRVEVIQPKRVVRGAAGHTWEQFVLPRKVFGKSTLWSPANTGPLAVFNQVLTLHDLTPLEHPEWFQASFSAWYRLFLPMLVRRVKHILTDSYHIRQKVIARFALSADRVTAVSCGVDCFRFHPQGRPAGLGKYILFVGSLEPRKNLPALLKAWKILQYRFQGISLLLAGDYGHVFQPLKLTPVSENVHFLGYVPEKDLRLLYSGALACVIPSLDEGFGLTALEAMASGAPVIASRAGALPEVVGEAGLLFDPEDTFELANSLEECISNTGLQQKMRQKGLERARAFSWANSAEQVWQRLVAL